MSQMPEVMYAWPSGKWGNANLSVYYGEATVYIRDDKAGQMSEILEQNRTLKFERDYANDMLEQAIDEIKNLSERLRLHVPTNLQTRR